MAVATQKAHFFIATQELGRAGKRPALVLQNRFPSFWSAALFLLLALAATKPTTTSNETLINHHPTQQQEAASLVISLPLLEIGICFCHDDDWTQRPTTEELQDAVSLADPRWWVVSGLAIQRSNISSVFFPLPLLVQIEKREWATA